MLTSPVCSARLFRQFCGILLGALLLPHGVRGENWPGWRGPTRNGLSAESGFPLEWSPSQGIAWKTALPGNGISHPVIWDNVIFVTSSDGPRQENLHVLALERKTGRILWERTLWGTAPTGYHAEKSSMASPTPVTDGRHLFTFFGTGDVFCFDFSGRLCWQRSLAAEYGEFENRFGHSSSPLFHDGMLLLQCDHYGRSYVLALDPETGANRWKTERPECWLSWSTPQLVPVGTEGNAELVLAGSEKLDGYDPRTGTKLWTIRGMLRECIPTIVWGEGLAIAVSGPKGPTLAFKPGGRGDVTQSHVVWRTQRGGPYVPSAIIVGDRYYVADDQGIATCLSVLKGDVLWQKRLRGAFTASPVSAEGKIYFVSEEGETVILDARPAEYRELARNPLGESVYASPVLSQGNLYLRGVKHLYCIGKPPR